MKSGRRRYTQITEERHVDLRRVLKFIAQTESITSVDLDVEFNWSRGKTHTALVDLIKYNLIQTVRCDSNTEGAIRRFHYAVIAHTEADLNKHLPITADMARSHNFLVLQSKVPTAPRVKNQTAVRRDPFVALLMGSGPAPSILSRNSA